MCVCVCLRVCVCVRVCVSVRLSWRVRSVFVCLSLLEKFKASTSAELAQKAKFQCPG